MSQYPGRSPQTWKRATRRFGNPDESQPEPSLRSSASQRVADDSDTSRPPDPAHHHVRNTSVERTGASGGGTSKRFEFPAPLGGGREDRSQRPRQFMSESGAGISPTSRRRREARTSPPAKKEISSSASTAPLSPGSSGSGSAAPTLRSILPDRWSCPERNSFGIKPDSSKLRLRRKSADHRSPAVVSIAANKPIPTLALQQHVRNQRTMDASNGGSSSSSGGGGDGVTSPRTYSSSYGHENSRSSSSHVVHPGIVDRALSPETVEASTATYLKRGTSSPSASLSPRGRSDPSGKDVYYFEVTVQSGKAWIGLFLKEDFMTMSLRGVSSSFNNNNNDPYPIHRGRSPGDSRGSIGLCSDGTLLVGGRPVYEVAGFRDFGDCRPGDVLGCGIEIMDTNKVFFTKNGRLLLPPRQYPGFEVKDNGSLPAVGIAKGSSNIVANFGLETLAWKGSDQLRLVSPNERMMDEFAAHGRAAAPFIPLIEEDEFATESVAAVRRKDDATHRRTTSSDARRQATVQPQLTNSVTWSQHLSSPPLSVPETVQRDSSLPERLESQGEQHSGSAVSGSAVGAQYVPKAASLNSIAKEAAQDEPTWRKNGSADKNVLVEPEEIEDAKNYASQLRSLCTNKEVDPIKSALERCQGFQRQVKTALEKIDYDSSDDVEEIGELICLHDTLLEAISLANSTLANIIVSETPTVVEQKQKKSKKSLDIEALYRNKDVFSLICMLRSQTDKRLDAALALMRLASGTEGVTNGETDRLRGEIRSSGGMHSLLTLFRSKGSTHELKVVAALAVAYLSPSFICNESSSLSSGGTGLKIIECLRYLTSSRSITPRDDEISIDEMCYAASFAATDFWMNAMVPTLNKEGLETPTEARDTLRGPRSALSTRARGRHLSISGSTGGFSEERHETLAVQELLEMTVSLIVHMAKVDCGNEKRRAKGTKHGHDLTYTLVESMCAVDLARPIAVREGVLRILVSWLASNDQEKIFPAATALKDLTSIQDKYMAGWIHSQMVNEGALGEVVKLLVDQNVRHGARLAVTQILSSLCVAPHTRAALVNAKCTAYLTPLLLDYADPASQPVALAAGTALLQLAAGAIARASVYRSDNLDFSDEVSSEKKDDVINDIVERGAIDPFIAMAGSSQRGELRLMSVEALRVISEDTHPLRQTRLLLCNAGAAKSLGHVLKEDVDELRCTNRPNLSVVEHVCDVASAKGTIAQDSLMELYQSLCALANILEPTPQGEPSLAPPAMEFQSSQTYDSQDALNTGCMQTAESGGLDSLLWIASLPVKPLSDQLSESIDQADLLIECCRSLASLSPLLLSEHAASKGCATWASDVLLALTGILKNAAVLDDEEMGLARELQFDALRGVGALAEFEPLKLLIVDDCLPFLLQTKNVRGERTDVSNVANQVCVALGFTEDELAVQVAGNDPKLLADWFCLQRSLVIQAMAREEVRRVLAETWKHAVRLVREKGQLPSKLVSEGSNHSFDSGASDGRLKGGSSDEDMALSDLFENLGYDKDSSELRGEILRHYEDIFERGACESGACHRGMNKAAISGGDVEPKAEELGLLSTQVYPLNQASTEREWILSHRRAIQILEGNRLLQVSAYPVVDRVQKLLDCCFPSRLLQKDVIPIGNLRPDASFDFRALLMPQRRYFSFRREGQLVSRLCDKHAADLESEDIHWTLGFTNSSFAGEFGETLIQALYRCPILQGLSFTRHPDWEAAQNVSKDNEGEDGSTSLANLAGSVPPWISSLTFDNILNAQGLETLVKILETMSKLSAGEEQTDGAESFPGGRSDTSNSEFGQKQGTFRCFAIRNSPHLGEEALSPFFNLLGAPSPRPRKIRNAPALSTLRVLDLSGNELGDQACAQILALAHQRESGCALEQLDLSGNSIRKGADVLKVLRSYVRKYRYNPTAGLEKGKRSWCSPLHTLNIGRNGLGDGTLATEILMLLANNDLALKSLDLSENGLEVENYDQVSESFVANLNMNTTLVELDLSGNKFSGRCLDWIIEQLNNSESKAAVAFLRFDNNTPPLSDSQRANLNAYVERSRGVSLERFLTEREQMRSIDVGDVGVSDDHKLGPSVDEERLQALGEVKARPSDETVASSVRFADDDTEDVSVYSQSEVSAATRDSFARRSSHANMITVLFSAPLVFHDEHRKLHAFAKLDFEMERELIWQCLKEACRDIDLSFDNATDGQLIAAMTKRCSCLHYSGHGHQKYLPLEDGKGGPNWLEVDVLEHLMAGGAPFKFVFVSACHSGLAGKTFASAGVPHVVCCQQESEVKDAAALAFTRQFYLALAVGRTVKESFDQGCKAVRAMPNLKDPEREMEKFLLLPRDGNHDVPVFSARPLREWPRIRSARYMERSRSRRGRDLTRSRSAYLGSARNSELSVRNMMQEDPSPTPPQFFLGREIDMYYVLQNILSKRLVNVVGNAGVGCSSLVCGLCHYINERRNTITQIDRIFYVKAKRKRRGDRSWSLLESFHEKLVEARNMQPLQPGEDMEPDVFERMAKTLKSCKALLVFDGMELLDGSEEAQDFPVFLSTLFRETKFVRVLLTGRKTLGIPSYGGVVEHHYTLGPMNFANTVKLFANLCPHLHTPGERAEFFDHIISDDGRVTDGEQASLGPNDERLDERTRLIFSRLGDGMPSRIEKAAYGTSADELKNIGSL